MNNAHLYTLATRVEQVERARQSACHATTRSPLAQRLQRVLVPFARLVNYFATPNRQAPPGKQKSDVQVWVE